MPPNLQSLKRRQGDIGNQVREAALGQHRESRSPWRLLTSTVRVGLAPHHHASDSADWHQANASPVLFPMPGGWVTPPAELKGKGMKISFFFWGMQILSNISAANPLPNSRSSPPCISPYRSDPVWVMPRSTVSLFSGFGKGKVRGKEETAEKLITKMDTRLDKEK